MSLLETLSKFAPAITKPNSAIARRDPVEGMRRNFVAAADEQIKQIKAAAEKGRWFAKQGDDTYVLCMRNGNKVIALETQTHFQAKNAADAVKFLEAAKKAVGSGEMDEPLKASALLRKKKEAAPEKKEPEKKAETPKK